VLALDEVKALPAPTPIEVLKIPVSEEPPASTPKAVLLLGESEAEFVTPVNPAAIV